MYGSGRACPRPDPADLPSAGRGDHSRRSRASQPSECICRRFRAPAALGYRSASERDALHHRAQSHEVRTRNRRRSDRNSSRPVKSASRSRSQMRGMAVAQHQRRRDPPQVVAMFEYEFDISATGAPPLASNRAPGIFRRRISEEGTLSLGRVIAHYPSRRNSGNTAKLWTDYGSLHRQYRAAPACVMESIDR